MYRNSMNFPNLIIPFIRFQRRIKFKKKRPEKQEKESPVHSVPACIESAWAHKRLNIDQRFKAKQWRLEKASAHIKREK
jgi:hypothetical protein